MKYMLFALLNNTYLGLIDPPFEIFDAYIYA
jgi:hypothetical protein